MPAGTDKPRCAAKVFDRFGSYSCTRTASMQYLGRSYCKQHHPPTVAQKNADKQEQWRKEAAESEAARKARYAAQAELERRSRAYDTLHGLKDYELLTVRELRILLEGTK
jgi:hypothetical protein